MYSSTSNTRKGNASTCSWCLWKTGLRLSFILLLLGICYAQTDPTKPVEVCNAGIYDIKSLISADYWAYQQVGGCHFDPSASCTFFFSFCKPLAPAGENCTGSGVCQVSSSDPNPISLGAYRYNPFIPTPDAAFIATFSGGSNTTDVHGQPCRLSAFMYFYCDSYAEWLVNPRPGEPSEIPPPVEVTYYDTSCTYNITLRYPGACPKILPTDPPVTAPIITPSDDVIALSAGVVFLIVFFTIAGTYLVFGMLFQGVVRKERGAKLIPNHGFWFALGGAIKYGGTFVWRKVTCQGGSPKATEYDQI